MATALTEPWDAALRILSRLAVVSRRHAVPVEDRRGPVAVGLVEEVDTEIEGAMDHAHGIRRTRRHAERGRGQADPGHTDTPSAPAVRTASAADSSVSD